MKFDGIVFRKAPQICILPIPNPNPKREHYAVFGKIIARHRDVPAEAIRVPGMSWEGSADENPVWALVIPSDGYSLTNMMYGQDNKIYLAKDGICYVAPCRRKDLTREALLEKIKAALPQKTVGLRKKRDGMHTIIASDPGCAFGYVVGKGLTWQRAYDDFLKNQQEAA